MERSSRAKTRKASRALIRFQSDQDRRQLLGSMRWHKVRQLSKIPPASAANPGLSIRRVSS